MAHVDSYPLTSEPQIVADNSASSQVTSFLIANTSDTDGYELLGEDDGVGQALGQGVPCPVTDRVVVDLPPGERLFAAADDSAGVELRVLRLRGS